MESLFALRQLPFDRFSIGYIQQHDENSNHTAVIPFRNKFAIEMPVLLLREIQLTGYFFTLEPSDDARPHRIIIGTADHLPQVFPKNVTNSNSNGVFICAIAESKTFLGFDVTTQTRQRPDPYMQSTR